MLPLWEWLPPSGICFDSSGVVRPSYSDCSDV
jgi:hypothetical protein